MIRLKVEEVAHIKGKSMYKLAKDSGINIATIRKLYRDPTRIVNTDTLDRLAQALGVDASELIESIPNPSE